MLDTIQKTIEPRQLKQLHTLLQQQNILHHKAEMVGGATNGRTESSRELTYTEAADLINQLQAMNPPLGGRGAWKPKPGEHIRRKIIAIAYNMQWEVPNPKGGKPKADIKRINDWCLLQQPKKKLNDCNVKELSLLVTIFEQKVYKQFLNGI